jgi:hypothetical protein
MAHRMSAATENRETARMAIEQVCARGDMALAPSCYAGNFADYFSSTEYHGLDGVRQSTELYRQLFDDLAFEVVDQVTEGDRVANRSPARTVVDKSGFGASRSADSATDESSRTGRASTASS